MSAAYFKAAIPEPYRILGLKLKPFSLGHYFLMRRFGNGFVGDETTNASREDLLLGILICSMRHDEFLKFIEQKDFIKQIKKWGKKAGIFDLPSKAMLFRDYLKAAQEAPQFWIEQEDGTESGGHWSQAVLTTLMGQLGYSRAEAMETPLAQALADFYKHAESLGIVRLMTDEEIAQVQEVENGP